MQPTDGVTAPIAIEDNVFIGNKSVHAKFSMKKYRYLQKGIEVVKAMGFKKAIGIYRRNPEKFRNMVAPGADRSLNL